MNRFNNETARKAQLASAEKRKQNRMEKRLIKQVIEERLKDGDLDEIIDNLIKRAKDDNNSFSILQNSLGQTPTNNSSVEITGVSLEKFLAEHEQG